MPRQRSFCSCIFNVFHAFLFIFDNSRFVSICAVKFKKCSFDISWDLKHLKVSVVINAFLYQCTCHFLTIQFAAEAKSSAFLEQNNFLMNLAFGSFHKQNSSEKCRLSLVFGQSKSQRDICKVYFSFSLSLVLQSSRFSQLGGSHLSVSNLTYSA
jgi:hypothetical protein